MLTPSSNLSTPVPSSKLTLHVEGSAKVDERAIVNLRCLVAENGVTVEATAKLLEMDENY
ncbi:hypothetical protein HZF08_17930 [Paenibacillus sp. CGMCC 1.16610]|uniref:Uncharacterized protein n=1 Tax=Paenibacillus anseongense TaxID=2682845 RepID=A0ABW9UES7_9BACL|nr:MULTISPECIES: hypothetical protein [Paenibacillus]MBA2940198.1 hypothetical protein [Paenibacillus sp. CGMCC 1.16610]MVQ38652.1 hypothetical protein [Paenibacillus anseongense]